MRFVVPVLLGIAVTTGRAQSPVANSDSTRGDSVARLSSTAHPELGRNTIGMILGSAGVAGAISLFDSRLSADAVRIGGDDMSVPSTISSFGLLNFTGAFMRASVHNKGRRGPAPPADRG